MGRVPLRGEFRWPQLPAGPRLPVWHSPPTLRSIPKLSIDDPGEPLVAVQLAQLDLPGRHQAEEQDQGAVLARQRALGLHPPAEFAVEPLYHVGRAARLPLLLPEPLHPPHTAPRSLSP